MRLFSLYNIKQAAEMPPVLSEDDRGIGKGFAPLTASAFEKSEPKL